jgi:hypothetical protein
MFGLTVVLVSDCANVFIFILNLSHQHVWTLMYGQTLAELTEEFSSHNSVVRCDLSSV